MHLRRRRQVHGGHHRQIGRHFRRAHLLEQGRAGSGTPDATGQHAHHQVAVLQRWRAHADGHVHALAHHVHAPVGGIQLQGHLRMQGQEVSQHAANARVQQCDRTGQPQHASRLGA
ncbi:hypothetical protein D3C73_1370340 [compost metagenome]